MISALISNRPSARDPKRAPVVRPVPHHRFHGDLAAIDLPTLLQMLAQRGLRGTLTVQHHGVTRRLSVDKDHVSLAAPLKAVPRGPRLHRPLLGEILMLHAMVDRRDLDEALARQRARPLHGSLGDLLLARHAISSSDLTRALAFQAAEELQELMHWRDGTFEFRQGAAAPAGAELPMPIYPLVMEAARRSDEWSRIRAVLPTKDRVAVRASTAETAAGNADRLTRAVLSLADGRRTVEEIIAQAGFPEFDAGGALARLIEQRRLILDRPPRERREEPPKDEALQTVVISPRFGFAAMLAAQLQDQGIPAEALRPDHDSASEAHAEVRPRIVVLDADDPDGAVRRIREHSRISDAKLIVLVSEPTRPLVLALLEHGADDVIVPPVPVERLALRIRRLALRGRARAVARPA